MISIVRRSFFFSGAFLLSICFLSGIFLGQVISSHISPSTGDELNRYLTEYLMLNQEGAHSGRTFASTCILYMRYPAFAFFLGFASCGILFLPVLTVLFGFFLSFSVSCFTASFGSSGVLLSLAAFGFRCLVTLPCYFLLAIPAMRTSTALFSLSLGSGRRAAPVLYGKACWLRFIWIALILSAGICVDFWISPWLLQQVISRFLVL